MPIGVSARPTRPRRPTRGPDRDRGAQSQVNLSWTASTDNVAVTGYRVERCRAPPARPSPNRDPDRDHLQRRGPQRGYDLSLPRRATDAAGNLSGYRRSKRDDAGHAGADGPDLATATAGTASRSIFLVGVHRQRRCHRLPGRALPGRHLHDLRPSRDPDRHHLQRHRTHDRNAPIATAYAQPMPPAT